MKKIILFLLIVSIFTFNFVLAENVGNILPYGSTFTDRVWQYNQDVNYGQYGEDYNCHRNLLWGYLEKDNPTQLDKDKIHLILKAMVYSYASVNDMEPGLMASTGCDENTGDGTVGFFKSVCQDNLFAVKLLDQYTHLVGSHIRQADLDLLESEFVKQMITKSNYVIAGNGNQQITVMPALYLYAEKFDPNGTIEYIHPCDVLGDGCESDQRWFEFSYNGHSYEFGKRYNTKQMANDWLEWTLDKFVFTKNFSDRYTKVAYYFEFDGKYPHAYMNGLANLCDMAEDSNLRTKACMVRDLFILDYFMDYNGIAEGGMHGGNPGRSGHTELFEYDYLYFGLEGAMHPSYPERNLYTITNDIPDVIVDAIVIEEEPSDYWHINMEYNPYLNNASGEGKYTYVDKSGAIDGTTSSTYWNMLESVYPGVSLPFERIETVDNNGNKIISWNGNVMTVSKNGKSCTYNFDNWSYDCGGSTTPPPTCNCTSYIGGNCGDGTCGLDEIRYTRSCTPSGCSTESMCQTSTTCPIGEEEEEECVCGTYSRGECGGGSCSDEYRQYTRLCNPSGCDLEYKCELDSECNIQPEYTCQLNGGLCLMGSCSGYSDCNSYSQYTCPSGESCCSGECTGFTIGNISKISPGDYDVRQLQVGSEYYVDRPLTIISMPSEMSGEDWIRTANDDKEGGSVSFTIEEPSYVYVSSDDRANNTWLSDYSYVGILSTEDKVDLTTRKKLFSPGKVNLGVNNCSDDSCSMYVVTVIPNTAPAPSPDINGDGIVNTSDLGILMSYWETNNIESDLNQDGVVDSDDFAIIYNNWD